MCFVSLILIVMHKINKNHYLFYFWALLCLCSTHYISHMGLKPINYTYTCMCKKIEMMPTVSPGYAECII